MNPGDISPPGPSVGALTPVLPRQEFVENFTGKGVVPVPALAFQTAKDASLWSSVLKPSASLGLAELNRRRKSVSGAADSRRRVFRESFDAPT